MAEPTADIPESPQPDPATQAPVRKRKLEIDKAAVGAWVVETLQEDLNSRSEWNDMRLQRYAKLRGWREAKSYPWDNASNAHIPLILQDSLRTQDTLHNAIMAQRPISKSKAASERDIEAEKRVDQLLDWQLFVEQNGEDKFAQLIQQFIDDGVFFAYVPWVRTEETVSDLREFEPIPEGFSVQQYMEQTLSQIRGEWDIAPVEGSNGWTWAGTEFDRGRKRRILIDAYVEQAGGPVQISVEREMETYNGPALLPKFVNEWVMPYRAENPQPPTPDNPKGADHVFLLDTVSLDEVKRLKASGWYNQLTDEDMAALEAEADSLNMQLADEFNDEHGKQKDIMEGIEEPHSSENQRAMLNRVVAFAQWDVNNDGLLEQVVFWVIQETKTVLRAALLTDMHPTIPPRRPLVARSFIPVEDRVYGMSLPELLESVHDLIKILFDQTVDSVTLKNTPFFFYRSTSGMRPETIRLFPGEGYPLTNPKDDVVFPSLQMQGESFALNLITLLNQFSERLSVVGELQFGRIPAGKSSALRTSGGISQLLQQGQARPERILRRFFSGIAEVLTIMHEMNQRFLPPDKEIRLAGMPKPGEEVYMNIPDRMSLGKTMLFDFQSSILHASRDTAMEAVQQAMSLIMNPLMLQLGLVTPDKAYALVRDALKHLSLDPEQYLNPPSPQAAEPKISAEEAIVRLVHGEVPREAPVETNPQEHFDKIFRFAQSAEAKEIGLDQPQLPGIFDAYLQSVTQRVQQFNQQQQLQQASAQFQQQLQGNNQGAANPPGAPGIGPGSNPPVNQNELLDESLPGAGRAQ